MPLNIKDEEAHRLAKALSERTGETMTQAVIAALRERMERVQRGRKARATSAELLEIGRRCAAQMERPAIDHGEFLYDERGLPR